MTDRYAVIGNPVAHSKSPQIHRAFAQQTAQDIDYVAVHCEIDRFELTLDRLRAEGYRGVNVTAPFKRNAYVYAETKSAQAERCGAVNTLMFDNGKIWGENTDGIGLTRDLETNIGVPISGARVLIIGAGGAARGVISAILDREPAQLAIANRTATRADELAALFADRASILSHALTDLGASPFDIVINATSAGLNKEDLDIPSSCFSTGSVAYEIVYALETPFMATARGRGLRVHDGLGMLVEQAAQAFSQWRGVRPETSAVLAMLREPK